MNTRLRLAIIALAAAALVAGAVSAAPITKALTVQVYQLCADNGSNCAPTGPAGDAYFAIETNKIWAQAGISVGFSFVAQIWSTVFSNIDDALANSFGALHALYGTLGPSDTVVDMFLVHTVAGAYGEGYLGQGGLVMAMDSVMAFGPNGRIDTIAHELGHNFGLVPTGLGGDAGSHSANANYLMAAGGNRNVPNSLADIAPSGLGYDVIPTEQLSLALQSRLLFDVPNEVPEPVGVFLTGSSLLALVIVRRRDGRLFARD